MSNSNEIIKKENNEKQPKVNPMRPDYYWLEVEVWCILQKHQTEIIKEVKELIEAVDKDHKLA